MNSREKILFRTGLAVFFVNCLSVIPLLFLFDFLTVTGESNNLLVPLEISAISIFPAALVAITALIQKKGNDVFFLFALLVFAIQIIITVLNFTMVLAGVSVLLQLFVGPVLTVISLSVLIITLIRKSKIKG